jgi:two-component system, LuxR family, response regulator FixJ
MTPNDAVVHVIDDDEAVRESLAFLLGTAGLTVETYETAVNFLGRIGQVAAGCVITDVRMPGMTGIELLRELKESGIGLPVVVMTGHGDIPLAVEAMKLGAVEFLEKPFEEEMVLSAVRLALGRHEREREHEAEIAAVTERLQGLSQRERQVLEGLVAGHPNKTIAYDLGISPRTVEIYRANLMTKMDASSLSQLVRMALIVDMSAAGEPKG